MKIALDFLYRIFFFAGLALTLLSFTVRAQQNLTWDTNGATTGTGGTGNWNTSLPVWSSGSIFKPWNNSTFDNALFGGTAGTVTLGEPINAYNLTFNVTGYTLTGSTLTLGGAKPTIITSFAGSPTTVNSTLGGSNGLVKSGPGTLILTAANTNFSGVTTITSGVLQINNANALGTSIAAGDLVLNKGSTFYFNVDFAHNYTLMGNSVSVGGSAPSVTWSGSPTLTASTTLNLNGTSGTLSGNLSDTGSNVLSLVRNGFNRMALTGNNSYTGPTAIVQGFLQLGSANALSAGSNLVFNGAVGTGGSLEMTSAYGNFTSGLALAQVRFNGSEMAVSYPQILLE